MYASPQHYEKTVFLSARSFCAVPLVLLHIIKQFALRVVAHHLCSRFEKTFSAPPTLLRYHQLFGYLPLYLSLSIIGAPIIGVLSRFFDVSSDWFFRFLIRLLAHFVCGQGIAHCATGLARLFLVSVRQMWLYLPPLQKHTKSKKTRQI